jgi:hypothetical protein
MAEEDPELREMPAVEDKDADHPRLPRRRRTGEAARPVDRPTQEASRRKTLGDGVTIPKPRCPHKGILGAVPAAR